MAAPEFKPYKELGRWMALAVLLRNQSMTGQSGWVHVGGMRPLHVTLVGNFTGTINIRVSNETPTPSGALADYPVWGDPIVSAPVSLVIDAPLKWLNLEVAALTGGSIFSADLMGG